MLISQPLKEACNKSFTDASRSHLLCPSPHPSLTDSSRASHPQPSLSYLIGFTITDISCPSSGQRHVDSGLCPEIKQYAVTGKKNHTHNSMRISHTHAFTHGRPVVTPRQKRQTTATESLHFHVASQFTEPWHHMGSSLLTK